MSDCPTVPSASFFTLQSKEGKKELADVPASLQI